MVLAKKGIVEKATKMPKVAFSITKSPRYGFLVELPPLALPALREPVPLTGLPAVPLTPVPLPVAPDICPVPPLYGTVAPPDPDAPLLLPFVTSSEPPPLPASPLTPVPLPVVPVTVPLPIPVPFPVAVCPVVLSVEPVLVSVPVLPIVPALFVDVLSVIVVLLSSAPLPHDDKAKNIAPAKNMVFMCVVL